MRTLRKVLFILSLALVVTSTAAVAAPAERPATADGRSISSWVLSALDSVLAFVLPDEYGGVVFDDPGGRAQSFDEDEPHSGEIGGVLDPSG